MSDTIEQRLDEIIDKLNPFNISYNDFLRIKPVTKQAILLLINEARNDSLLDLENWAKLHNLDAEMILDGIEHMVISNLQVPNQPRRDNSERIAQLTPKEDN